MRTCTRVISTAAVLAVLLGSLPAACGQEGASDESSGADPVLGPATLPGPATQGGAEDTPLDLDGSDQEPVGAPTGSPGRYLLRALLSLAIVVALIYALFFGARLWRQARGGPRMGTTAIEVLDRARIDADKTIYVVALGQKTIVLGGSGGEMRFICELDEAEAATFRAESTEE
jgi:flagellar biogenesis protein FliO